MKVFAVIFLFAFVLSVQCQWESTAWTNEQGTLSVCVDGSSVSAIYQESTSGICQGTVDGDTISGNFYEGAGLACNSGTFTWTIAEDGNSFLGTFNCDDDGSDNNWAPSIRIGSDASTESCGRLGGSISGVWGVENIVYDICIDGGEYESSYSYDSSGTTVNGYETGDMVLSSQVGSGTYSESNGSSGSSLFFSLDNGSIGNIYDSDGEFFYDVHAGVSGSASSDACGRNDPDGGNDDIDISTFFSTVDVSTFFSTVDVSTFFSTVDVSTFFQYR